MLQILLLDPHSYQIWLWTKFLGVPYHTTHGCNYNFSQGVTGTLSKGRVTLSLALAPGRLDPRPGSTLAH